MIIKTKAMTEHIFTLLDGKSITIKKEQIAFYRASGEGTVFFMNNESIYYVKEAFTLIYAIFDL